MGKKNINVRKIFSSAYRKTLEFLHRPWFYNKKFLVTLSVLCSVALWAFLATNISPVETKTISSVPITVNVETIKENFGLDFVEVISPESLKELELDVTVSGRKYLISQLTANDFSAVASANQNISKPGSYDLTLMVTANNPMLDVNIQTNNIPMYVRFDRYVDKEFTVSNVVGVGATILKDSDLIMGTPYSNVTKVYVSGPETEVTQIASVIVSADVNKELYEGETFAGKIVFLNEAGDTLNLNHVTVGTDSVDSVSVTIPIKTSKEFKVVVDFANAPKNFDSTKIPLVISPGKLNIIGTPDAINNIDQNYQAGTIDLAKLTNAPNQFAFDVSLSTGLDSVENVEKIHVSIDLSDYHVEKIGVNSRNAEFKITNYTGTRKVAFKTTALDQIAIIGPAHVVEKLKASDILVEADMTGKETVTGQCTVNAVISIKNYTNCWAIGTYEVDVMIG